MTSLLLADDLTFTGHPRIGALAICLAVITACAPRDDAAMSDTLAGDVAAPAPTATRMATVEGFSTPESVRYDPDQDVFFVSNINGNPGAKANNGFISRVRPDGTVDSLRFIAGGRGGATLHAPKGMALVGDTLWVADIDAVRAFNRRTGAPVATVDMRGRAKFLNDVAAGPDGSIYVTDTGIEFSAAGEMSHPGPDRVVRITGRNVEIVLEGEQLAGPNGVTWDQANDRLLIVSFAGNDVGAWRSGDQSATTIASGVGQFDGVEVIGGGRIVVSSWADSSVYLVDPATRSLSPLIKGVPAPADLGFDTQRARLAIPLFQDNRVEFWEVR